MSFSIGITLDTRRKKKTGKFPVKLRVRLETKVELYSTIYDLSEDEYNKFSAPRISDDLQEIRNNLQRLETDAKKVVQDEDITTIEVFERDFVALNPLLQKRKKKKGQQVAPATFKFDITPYEKRFTIFKETHPGKDYISVTFVSYIKRLLEEERIGSALNYLDTYNSLKKFRGNIRFVDITVSYLHQYERWMINENNCSRTTVGIKLRALRAVFNEADENGIINKRNCYPFGRRKYQIPTSRNVKKALELSDIQKIYDYMPDDFKEQQAKAYWLFCYFGNGMNPKDLAYLKYKNIDGEFLSFIRAKTERATRSNPKLITVFVNEDMKEIIDTWGNCDKNPDNYIFPVLHPKMNPMEQYNAVKFLVRYINEGMAGIATHLKISKKVNNMVCRHTYSTVMKRSGASTEFIQEALGHMDKKTTENYLDSFENQVKKEFAAKLIAFKKKPVRQKLEKEAIS